MELLNHNPVVLACLASHGDVKTGFLVALFELSLSLEWKVCSRESSLLLRMLVAVTSISEVMR